METIAFALACYRSPLAYHDQLALTAPLPKEMEYLLWVANGSSEAMESAVSRTGAKPQELRDAARFCIQQLCFARGADHYRVLGLEPGASFEQIKEHHRLLMRLFHPDRTPGRETWTDHYATRVNEAWNRLSRLGTHWHLSTVTDTPTPQLLIPVLPELSAHQPQFTSTSTHSPANLQPTLGLWERPSFSFGNARQWLPKFVLGSLFLLALLLIVLAKIDWVDHLAMASPANSAKVPLKNTAVAPIPAPEPPSTDTTANHSAISSFSALPDWQILTRQQQQNHPQIARTETISSSHSPYSDHEKLAAQEALLKQLWKQPPKADIKSESSAIEKANIGWLIAEQQRLEQMKANQAQIERLRLIQDRIERLTLEQRRLQEFQTKLTALETPSQDAHSKLKQQDKTSMPSVPKQRQGPIEEQNRVKAQPVYYQVRPVTAIDPASTAPKENQVTQLELKNFLSRYTHAYERGSASDIMRLFTPDAQGKGGSSRSSIYHDYATLFNSHPIRQLRLHNWNWTPQGSSASGSGQYKLQLKQLTGSESTQVEGSIYFKVRKKNRQVLIEAIDYDWNLIGNR